MTYRRHGIRQTGELEAGGQCVAERDALLAGLEAAAQCAARVAAQRDSVLAYLDAR